MKFFILSSLFIFTVSCNSAEQKVLPANTTAEKALNEIPTQKAAEEDCDDKAKKAVEIKEDSISLTGNTGCTLDEAKP